MSNFRLPTDVEAMRAGDPVETAWAVGCDEAEVGVGVAGGSAGRDSAAPGICTVARGFSKDK